MVVQVMQVSTSNECHPIWLHRARYIKGIAIEHARLGHFYPPASNQPITARFCYHVHDPNGCLLSFAARIT